LQIPKLKSPAQNSENGLKANEIKNSESLVVILLSVIIGLLIIIIALLFLPDNKTQENPVTTVLPKENKIDKINDVRKVKLKNKLESTIDIKTIEIDWMLKKALAEELKMPIWSPDDFNEAVRYEELARQYSSNNNLNKSKENYIEATKKIDLTLENKEEIYNELIIKGTEELNNNELEKSKNSFIQAQSIFMEEQVINRFFVRIENRNTIIQLYEDSIEFEKKHNLLLAIEVLKKAIELEPEYEKLINRLLEVQRKKDKIEFNDLVGKILNALDSSKINLSQLKEVKNKINRLKSINRKAPIINELEEKYEIKKENKFLKNYYQSALNQEALEQWKNAIKQYDSVLKINLNHSKSIVRKERAKSYQYLNDLIDSIIKQPERLQNDKIFNKSQKSLNYVKSEISKKSSEEKQKIPKLIEKISSAESLIEKASTMVDVIIYSDAETDISIYRVGRFGQFKTKELQLRPGKYTIVGSRLGYKDIRKNKNISASDKVINISIICSEKI